MIRQFSEEIKFKLPNFKMLVTWITKAIENEGFNCGHINYIFCDDQYLNKINKEYLNHEDYTDIITFNYNQEESISGDIFISIDRVKENANNQNVSFENELNRVMIHGVLHLCGYNDKTGNEKQEMRAKEDYYLNLQT